MGARARRPLLLVQATQQVREHALEQGREGERDAEKEREGGGRAESPAEPRLQPLPPVQAHVRGVCQARPQSLLPHAREAGEATNTAPQTQFSGPLKTSCVSTPQHAHRATFP